MRNSVTRVTAKDGGLSYGHRSESETLRRLGQGAVMLKTIVAILVAAFIAATITVISAPITDVVASPLPKPAAEAITACKQAPWPYLNCVGTEFGNPHVRLISVDNRTH